jgi:hypothetical protein
MSAAESRSKTELTLDEHGDRVGLLDVLDESVLFLSERVLVDSSSPTKDIGCQVINRVLGDTTDTQLQPYCQLLRAYIQRSLPLHVSSLCSPEGKDTVLDEDI